MLQPEENFKVFLLCGVSQQLGFIGTEEKDYFKEGGGCGSFLELSYIFEQQPSQ